MKISKDDMEYLVFLQEQMEDRDYKKAPFDLYARDCKTEYFILNMCWWKFLAIKYGIYPALDAPKPFGSGRGKQVWNQVKKYREKKLLGIRRESYTVFNLKEADEK